MYVFDFCGCQNTESHDLSLRTHAAAAAAHDAAPFAQTATAVIDVGSEIDTTESNPLNAGDIPQPRTEVAAAAQDSSHHVATS